MITTLADEVLDRAHSPFNYLVHDSFSRAFQVQIFGFALALPVYDFSCLYTFTCVVIFALNLLLHSHITMYVEMSTCVFNIHKKTRKSKDSVKVQISLTQVQY